MLVQSISSEFKVIHQRLVACENLHYFRKWRKHPKKGEHATKMKTSCPKFCRTYEDAKLEYRNFTIKTKKD